MRRPGAHTDLYRNGCVCSPTPAIEESETDIILGILIFSPFLNLHVIYIEHFA